MPGMPGGMGFGGGLGGVGGLGGGGLGGGGGFGGIGLGTMTVASYPPAGSVEGAYLKGYGVIFCVAMNSAPSDVSVRSLKPVAKAGDWEEVQRQVRGDKPAKKKKGRLAPTVTEIILKAFAENGKHFSQLKADEVLTVVVTFRYPQPASKGGSKPTTPAGKPSTTAESSTRAPAALAEKRLQNPASARDYELLADLLLKQGKAAEAVDALKKSLDMDAPAADRIRLFRKLAQAYLASDRDAEAQKTLQSVAELKQKSPAAKSAAAPAPAPRSLPPQLIISAPKALLDRVGAGQITLEDFHRAVTIDAHGLPLIENP